VITSRLTTKARTTIPRAVRTELRLEEGDTLAYTIEERRVIITKGPPRKGDPLNDPFAAFWEWDSEEDNDAFSDF
jgi:antitoxin PrlF